MPIKTQHTQLTKQHVYFISFRRDCYVLINKNMSFFSNERERMYNRPEYIHI